MKRTDTMDKCLLVLSVGFQSRISTIDNEDGDRCHKLVVSSKTALKRKIVYIRNLNSLERVLCNSRHTNKCYNLEVFLVRNALLNSRRDM